MKFHRAAFAGAICAVALGIAGCNGTKAARPEEPGATAVTASTREPRSTDPRGAEPTTTADAQAAARCGPPYPTGRRDTSTVFCADPSTMQAGRVLRIVDGDTLHAQIDGRDETIRFFGTDTPERGEACYDEASERLRELAGEEVRLRPDARERDRYGRLLRYVYMPDGRSIDATMIAEGYAHAWTADGAFRDPLVALERGARAAHTGCLWQQ